MTATGIQATIYAGYGTAAQALGAISFGVVRPAAGQNPIGLTPTFSIPAAFTNAKVAGYNFERASNYDDVVFAGLFDATNCQLGDYLFGADGRIFFITAMQPYLPVLCVQCNRTATWTRSLSSIATGGAPANAGPSQPGGSIPFFGRREDPASNVTSITAPACFVASAGRATSHSEFPSAAPGPSRWRVYLAQSTFPKGTINDRDILTDEEGNRHMVEAAGWLNQGYRLEMIRDML